jgi:hypothetical protein
MSVSGSYRSPDQFRTLINGVTTVADTDSLFLLRAALAIAAPAGWTASLYGENLNNSTKKQAFGALTAYSAALPFGRELAQRARPRTVGIQVDYKF